MSLSFVLVGAQIKRFKTVVKALAGIGSELLVEALPEKLILRAINSAHSAFLAVSLSSQFFESYNVFSQKGVVQAGVLIKHLLATFRSTRVATMACELNEEQANLRVNLRCDNGLMKRYGLDINSTDILQANLDSAGLPVSVVAEAPELNKLLNTFQSTLDEVSIIALPDQLSTAGTGTHGQAAAARCVKLQSFYDPAKAAGSKALHTCMALATTHVFKSYSNSASAPSDVTINLKDLKTLVGLCVELGADVVLKFDEAGVPLLALPHAPGQQAMDYTAELILSTLQESVHRPEDDDAAWQQQDPAAAAGGHPNGAPAAAAERAETIAPASVTRGGDMGAAGAAETPQGPGSAGSASVLRFRQTRAPSAAAAAAGGGVSGGGAFSGGARSGGRARSGGVSRFDQLEAALAEEEARQQQEQQYIQQQRQQQYSSGAAAGTSMGPPASVGPAAAGAGLVTPISRPQQQQQQPHWAQQQDPASIPQQQQWGQPPLQQWGQPSQQQQQQWGHQAGAVPQGVSQEAGDPSLECSLADVEALPGHNASRSPAPNAAAAAAAAAAAGQAGMIHRQQHQDQEQPWAGFPQQQQQQQQQGGVYEGGGELEGMDEDEELPETPEGSEQGDMDTGGLGEL